MTPSMTWPMTAVIVAVILLVGWLAHLDHGAVSQILTLLAGGLAGWLMPSPLAKSERKAEQ